MLVENENYDTKIVSNTLFARFLVTFSDLVPFSAGAAVHSLVEHTSVERGVDFLVRSRFGERPVPFEGQPRSVRLDVPGFPRVVDDQIHQGVLVPARLLDQPQDRSDLSVQIRSDLILGHKSSQSTKIGRGGVRLPLSATGGWGSDPIVVEFYRVDQPRKAGRWSKSGGGSAGGREVHESDTVVGSAHVVAANGEKIRLSTDGVNDDPAWTKDLRDQMLNGLADAYDRDPTAKPPSIVVRSTAAYAEHLESNGMPAMDAMFAAASSRAGVNSRMPTVINFNLGVMVANPYSAETAASKWSMPSAHTNDPTAYTMTHEYGHSKYFQSTDMKTQVRLGVEVFKRPDVKSALSEYGRTNHLEGYAEAYAEWSLTGGKSTNKAVATYAETFSWEVKE